MNRYVCLFRGFERSGILEILPFSTKLSSFFFSIGFPPFTFCFSFRLFPRSPYLLCVPIVSFPFCFICIAPRLRRLWLCVVLFLGKMALHCFFAAAVGVRLTGRCGWAGEVRGSTAFSMVADRSRERGRVGDQTLIRLQ
ncbi:uncharacterized protein LY79DRAFT_557382 [Colletotrichum navitas]|uniref:Transmembrane protein n=1 Tax=Colletotrichum navitas TaxID=681940 RepID=A0AAD8V3Q3_9PEZI|nr:uncharacterized protein LY79DRAFT_557382 [Colletotrichum navitas]KAK1586057.1 hypothetical protein LY79DRAFT_557382 [Colletotrichum navitas]